MSTVGYYFGSYLPFPCMSMSVIAVYSLNYGGGYGDRYCGDGLVFIIKYASYQEP